MHTVAYYTKRITRYWTASLQDRVRSCEFYAQARNELDTISLQALESVEPLVNMTPSQRGVLHRVGSGIIIPEYLDCHCPGIPLAMERLKVDKVDQADIWGNGLIMATITGGYKTVMIPAMRESDVCQVFKADGTKRSAAEQIKWLRDLARPALDVMENHSIYCAHRMYITPEKLTELLRQEPYVLTPAVLRAIADSIESE